MFRYLISALLVLTAFSSHSEAASGRVALVIGNSAYTEVGALANPKNDAADISAALTRLGFEVSHQSDLDAAKFRAALKSFEEKASGADMAVVYYAGHGIEVGGTNYLIPTDAALKRDTHVEDEAIPLSRVITAVESAKGFRLIMLDACRDNPFIRQMTRSAGASRSIGRGLAAIEPPGATLVAYAARDGTEADDGTGRNSPFAAALLKNIEEPGLEVTFLFRRVRDQVLAATGGVQTPYVYGSLGSEAIYLKPGEGASPAPSADPMRSLYSNAERIGTVEAWDVFLKTCKDSPYCGFGQAARAKAAAPQVAVGIHPPQLGSGGLPKPGESFKDCGTCPEMVVVPAGSFTMGAAADEEEDIAFAGPQRQVVLAQPFAVGKFEVTFEEWDACVAEGGCSGGQSDDNGWGRGRRPAINVNWDDAKKYVAWLSRKTGKAYRLLSEAEWEYAARAGTTTRFSFGASISTAKANYRGSYDYLYMGKKGFYHKKDPSDRGGESREQPVPVGNYSANRFGLHDMHGNVSEWVEDCRNLGYLGAHPPGEGLVKPPSDGSAFTKGECDSRVSRGGSWYNGPREAHSAARDFHRIYTIEPYLGFRVAQTLATH